MSLVMRPVNEKYHYLGSLSSGAHFMQRGRRPSQSARTFDYIVLSLAVIIGLEGNLVFIKEIRSFWTQEEHVSSTLNSSSGYPTVNL
jgi:hypothetical protein